MRTLKIKTILITGATGVLAKHFMVRNSTQYKFVLAVRNPSNENEVLLDSWKFDVKEKEVDLVLHFAGKYLVEESIDAKREVYNSVVGTAAAIANYCGDTGTPLIALGSYFENAPEDQQPWSYYASAKKTARELLILEAKRRTFKLRYVFCYDTYGSDLSRKKIIDVLLSSETSELDLSEGLQKMNITHLDDFSLAIEKAIENIFSTDGQIDYFQLKNPKGDYTLREIAATINEARANKVQLNFGAKPYRDKEVFEIWDSARTLPGWTPKIDFIEFVNKFLENKDA